MDYLDIVKKNAIGSLINHQIRVKTSHTKEFDGRILKNSCSDGKFIYYFETIGAHSDTVYLVDMVTLKMCDAFKLPNYFIKSINIDQEKKHLVLVASSKKYRNSISYILIFNIQARAILFEWMVVTCKHIQILRADIDNRFIYYMTENNKNNQFNYHIFRMDLDSGNTSTIYAYHADEVMDVVLSNPLEYITFLSKNINDRRQSIRIDTKALVSESTGEYNEALKIDRTFTIKKKQMIAIARTDDSILLYNIRQNKVENRISLSMLNRNKMRNEMESASGNRNFSCTGVYLNENNTAMCVVYHHKFGCDVFAEIVDLREQETAYRITNLQHHSISSEFEESLEEWLFDREDIETIGIHYRISVIGRLNTSVEDIHLAYSQRLNTVCIGGKEHGSQAVLRAFDFDRFAVCPSVCVDALGVNGVYFVDNILTYQVTLKNNATASYYFNLLVYNDFQPDRHGQIPEDSGVFFSSPTLTDYALLINDEKTKVNVKKKDGTIIGSVAARSDKKFRSVIFAHNKNMFYTVDDENIERWDMYQLNNPEYKPFVIPNYENGYYASFILSESENGRYAAIKGKNHLLDLKTGKKIGAYDRPIDFIIILFIEDNLKFLLSRENNQKVHIHSCLNYELLADINFMSNGRFIIQAKADKIAKNGWFYTNCPDDMNIYATFSDGTRKVLNPGEKMRQDYISSYNRRDMVKYIVLNSNKYGVNAKMISGSLQDNDKDILLLSGCR